MKYRFSNTILVYTYLKWDFLYLFLTICPSNQHQQCRLLWETSLRSYLCIVFFFPNTHTYRCNFILKTNNSLSFPNQRESFHVCSATCRSTPWGTHTSNWASLIVSIKQLVITLVNASVPPQANYHTGETKKNEKCMVKSNFTQIIYFSNISLNHCVLSE